MRALTLALRDADPRDFPFELDTRMLLNLAPHQFAEAFDELNLRAIRFTAAG